MTAEQKRQEWQRAKESYEHAGVTDHPEYRKICEQMRERGWQDKAEPESVSLLTNRG